VGDLDGDGLPDVLVDSYLGTEDDSTDTIIAKRGINGTHLWEESITGDDANIEAEVVGDLDGDGLPDVLVQSSAGPYGNVTAAVIAKRGNDGTHLWEESLSGDWVSISANVVSDLDGDGLPDVLVEIYVEDTDTETLIAKKGSDGTHLWEEFAPPGHFNLIDARVVGDLDGDGLSDVLVRIDTGPLDNETSTLIAKVGINGTHLWEESVTGYDASISWHEAVRDLDGDGLPDVLVSSRVGPYGNKTYAVIAKKMSDGTHLWEESVSGSGAYTDIEVEVVGDLDGDGLPDVLVYSNVGSYESQTFTVIAKKGSNGTHLWEESVSGGDTYTNIQAEGVVADFDGDGLPDVLVQSLTGSAESQTYTAIGKKGSDGTHLWEAESNEEILFASWEGEGDEDDELVFRDLDGDGKADALIRISNQVCAVSVGEEAPPPPPSLPAAVPSVTRWGIVGMIAAFGLLLALMARRRLAAR